MALFKFVFLIIFVSLAQFSLQISDIDEAHVSEMLTEMTVLMRQKHNVTRAFMELSPDLMKKSLVENDLRLTVPQASRMLDNLKTEMGIADQARREELLSRRVDPDPSAKWSFPIHYAFDGTHSDSEKSVIRNGLQRWEAVTCVAFKEHSSQSEISNQAGLVISKGSGCWSYVGKISDDSPQQLSLGDGCVYPGIASHESGHALGLWHEHMRPDRDNYIKINYGNMISGYEGAFAKVAPADDVDYGTGYDHTSTMHYDSLGFSVDYWGKKRVIVPTDPHLITAIGQREYLSFNDAKRINMHYGCIAKLCSGAKLSQTCQNGGYQDPKNCVKCRCPLGFGGDFCQNAAPAAGGKDCGGTIQIPQCSSVTLTSPSYPSYYSPSTSCSWNIQSPGGLVFAFESQPQMPSKESDTCLDFVDIITDMSKTTVPGGRFCIGGKSGGRIAATDSGQAFVVFSSTSSEQGGGNNGGFKLNIYSTCSGTSVSSLTEECLITSTGYDYEGSKTSSDSGTCYAWAGQSNLGDLSFPDNNLQDAGSNCRNPDSRAYPWCYTGRSYSSVGYCKGIPQCPLSGSPATTPAPVTTTGRVTTTPSAATTTTKGSSKCTNSEYSQCGGKGYTGTTCCPSGTTCVRLSDWYSSCKRSSKAKRIWSKIIEEVERMDRGDNYADYESE